MRRFIAILLFVVFSLSSLFKLGIVANYYINFQYYAEVLCDNKDKPELQCNGQCHLKEELKQTENNNDENMPEIVSKLRYSDFVMQDHLITFRPPILHREQSITWQRNCDAIMNGYPTNVFRPPIV